MGGADISRPPAIDAGGWTKSTAEPAARLAFTSSRQAASDGGVTLADEAN